MTGDLLGFTFTEPEPAPPSGNADRFGGRWRLIGAGLSNVWRYGDLDLAAPSGRLLMRGPNGTGKTTALEALWPYLLDLNAAKLGAGKARPTSLKLLMSEGATSKRRYGYAWLTFAPPSDDSNGNQAEPAATFGVRLQYSENGSPAVTVIPFIMPGRPLHDVPLHGEHHTAFELEEFITRITAVGGQIFDADDGYVDHLAARVWQTSADELRLLAGRLREVRNPTLLGDVSAQDAATALRASLPGVSEQVLTATADALAESKATRDAFTRDKHAADVLADFAAVWAGHVIDVVRTAHTEAMEAATVLGHRAADVRRLTGAASRALADAQEAAKQAETLEDKHRRLTAAIRAIEISDAYQAAGRLAAVDQTLIAQRASAEAELGQLLQAAATAADTTRHSRDELTERHEDLESLIRSAIDAGAPPVAVGTLLSWTDRPRSTHHVATRSIDPGPGLSVRHEPADIDKLAADWRTIADQRAAQADAAHLAIRDHSTVEATQAKAASAVGEANQAEQARDLQQQLVQRAAADAETAADTTAGDIRQWALQHPSLRDLPSLTTEGQDEGGLPDAAHDTDEAVWDLDDLSALAGSEPALVLETLDRWADLARRIAERIAAAEEQQARQESIAAATDRADAAEHRARAHQLRSGELLTLPRPAWAGPGQDSAALGSVLEWTPGTTDDAQRALLEVALAEAGVLGATLTDAGAAADHWQIDATGEPAESSLADVLTVDRQHPLAEHARAVLTRIQFLDTATGTPAAALVIGRDGTFRAGVLSGRPAAALAETGQVPPARHVGARRRREAARAEADRLKANAISLDTSADAHDAHAVRHRHHAKATRQRAATFPPRNALRKAEYARAAAASRATDLHRQAEEKRGLAEAARQAYADELTGWTERTTARNLPADLDQLKQILTDGRGAAQSLRSLADTLTRSVVSRLRRTLSQLINEAQLTRALAEQAATARESYRQAADTEAILTELRRRAGGSDETVARHRTLTGEAAKTATELGPAQERKSKTEQDATALQAKLESAQEELVKAQPAQLTTADHLVALLTHPAVAQALTLNGELNSGERLLEQVNELLTGRRAHNRRFLGERYDSARAELAGTWTLARGDAGPGLDELDMFVLTHSEREYTPAAAASRAAEMAANAEKALAAAEQTALTDFVIGRLPSAIGAAWTRMQDWKLEVNRKMRSAEASSGVGVQVQVDLSADLPPLVRTVYELSCKVSDADRTDAQKAEVGTALQALLGAADGDTMLERLSAAADIRDWVDVHYLVTRPDRNTGVRVTGRWNRRTGLSGGERRLVVLAPMLAAAAAAYDRLGPAGLRLVPLDEVPAEVDEHGREGLARYIAELDLDLLCTSYLWDGSPGAWDGVDAHDLEAAPDGTVVAFPMLVRGLLPLTGDSEHEGDT